MATECYATSVQHLLAELERIDLLIQAQVARARQIYQTTDEFHGLYIPEQEVDTLLSAPAGLPRWATALDPFQPADLRATLERIRASIEMRTAESFRRGIRLRLDELARFYCLNPFDVDVLLVCLAPELDLRYERLFAYLQDDVTKKRPSVDLVLNLLSDSIETKLKQRQSFAASTALLKHDLISLFEDPSQPHPPLLSRYLKIDARVADYLLELDEVDSRLKAHAQVLAPKTDLEDLLLPADMKDRLAKLAAAKAPNQTAPIFYFQGPYGVGKRTAAAALCKKAGKKLLVVDGEHVLNSVEDKGFASSVALIVREARLQSAALYWNGFDALLADDKRASRDTLLRRIQGLDAVTFLAGNTTWEPVEGLPENPFIRVEFPRPGYGERVQLWTKQLNHTAPGAGLDIEALAGAFRFSGGQIRDAAATAGSRARWRDPGKAEVTMADLHAACRLQSNRKLATLAQKITPRYGWDDIVLPAKRLQHLREAYNAAKHSPRVYGEWGFGQKLSLGKGLNALFAGPSGTGKTMAAEIFSGELALDLYKIDLSTVVSKYIGETEKNLSRIFAEAETANAILFFDEADALFGQRSEVRDSHDRYANIEIGYLLQRMEEYEGIVILATNLSKNMDEAFVRRMHYTVEFPFPNERDRRRIWERVWPEVAPLSPALDLDFMARHFELAGGNIKNVALASAFLAANDGGLVDMSHLIRATQREYQKMGKVMIEDELGKFSRSQKAEKFTDSAGSRGLPSSPGGPHDGKPNPEQGGLG
jgi:SpoVK/Ycf46/Vps4 family AAA+-type ATPase